MQFQIMLVFICEKRRCDPIYNPRDGLVSPHIIPSIVLPPIAIAVVLVILLRALTISFGTIVAVFVVIVVAVLILVNLSIIHIVHLITRPRIRILNSSLEVC
jgi:tellurite resistance protein TehA-like permease